MTGRRRRAAAAWGAVALSFGVAAAGLAELASAPGGGDWVWTFATVLSYGPAGALLRDRAPRLAVAFLAVAGFSSVALLAGEHADLTARQDGVPGGALAVWLSSWTWVPPYVVVVALLPYLLPDGRPGGRLASWGARTAAATCAVATAAWALAPYDELDEPSDAAVALAARNPVGVEGAGTLVAASLVAVLACVAGGLVHLALRWRAAQGDDRARLAWVLLGVVGTTGLLVAAQAAPAGSALLQGLAAVPLPASVLVAVLRHGLWDRDRLLGRSLVWLALSGLVAAAFVVVVAVLGGQLGSRVGAPLVAAGLVSLLVLPLVNRLQSGVSRLLYGDQAAPHEAVGRLVERLALLSTPQEALAGAAEGVGQALRLSGVRLSVVDGPTSSWGRPSETPDVTVPLLHAGDVVGELEVSGVTGPGSRRLLEALAAQAGAVARAAQLETRLQRARGRTEETREEERRRLRRDLHDSLGPTLAGIALQLEHLPDVVAQDPVAASAVARRLTTRAQDAVVDVRRLVEDLGPSRDLGVVEALRAQVAAFDAPTLRSSLEAGDVGEVPAAVEAVAIRVVGEALHNVVRHAGAGTCRVRVGEEEGSLVVTVHDDGVGLGRAEPVTRGSGLGLASMAEAAAELGGECTVRATTPAGTEVRLVLPVETDR